MTDFRQAQHIDGTPVVVTNIWPLDESIVWCGQGDDITNGTIGSGADFRVQRSAVGTTTVESQFTHAIRLGGGHVVWRNCEWGDYADQCVIAPATVGVSNPAAGAYAKLDLGGGNNLYVAPGTPGAGAADWDLNLTETLNGNVSFTKVVPVPATAGNGFFTHDVNVPGVVTYTPGTGTHNLFDFEVPLTQFIRKMWLIGTSHGQLGVSENIPATVLPQWKQRVVIHRELATGSDREVIWTMLISRGTTI